MFVLVTDPIRIRRLFGCGSVFGKRIRIQVLKKTVEKFNWQNKEEHKTFGRYTVSFNWLLLAYIY